MSPGAAALPRAPPGAALGVGPREEATATNMVAAWMQSEHHRVNIMLPAFRDIGVGATLAEPDPAFYADRPSLVVAPRFVEDEPGGEPLPGGAPASLDGGAGSGGGATGTARFGSGGHP